MPRRRPTDAEYVAGMRVYLGLSQRELGLRLRMSQSNVAHLEGGLHRLGSLERQELERMKVEREAQLKVDEWQELQTTRIGRPGDCQWWLEAGRNDAVMPSVEVFMRHLRTCAHCLAIVHRNMFMTDEEEENFAPLRRPGDD